MALKIGKLIKIVGVGVLAMEGIDSQFSSTEKVDLITLLAKKLKKNKCELSVCAAAHLIWLYLESYAVSDTTRSREEVCTCDPEEAHAEFAQKVEETLYQQQLDQEDSSEAVTASGKFDSLENPPSYMVEILEPTESQIVRDDEQDEVMTELDALFEDPFFVGELVESLSSILTDRKRLAAHFQVAKLLDEIRGRFIIPKPSVLLAKERLASCRKQLIDSGHYVFVSAFLNFELSEDTEGAESC